MSKSFNFLQSLAQKCHEQFGDKCDELTIIFPNKRAGVYFAKYLSRLFDRPVWSPKIYSFEEYVIGAQNRLLGDELQLNLALYDAYKRLVSQPESFDSFLPWGEMILKDFNDIDNYLVDPEHIFRVVKSQKELDESFAFLSERDQKVIQQFWSGFLPSPTKKQNEFIQTWSILHELYVLFNEELEKEELVYKGRLFKEFSEAPIAAEGIIWFAGFNALTKAEERIIKHYLEAEENDIHWEVDRYYFEDENQESGVFFREYAADRTFAPSIKRDLIDQIKDPKKDIEVIDAPFSTGQILSASQCIGHLKADGKDLNNSLIILTDESLLDNLLKSLPEGLEDVNITMGWPLAKSRLFLSMSRVVSMVERLNEKGFSNFQKREVDSLFEFKDLLNVSDETFENYKSESIENNKIYYSLEELLEVFPELSHILVRENQMSKYLDHMIGFLQNLQTEDWSELEQSVVALLHQKLKHVLKAIDESQVSIELKSFVKLFRKLGQSIKVPLSGDPTRGLQIMGILETRNLTFENVVVVGMNEGFWPKDSSNSSFIPYNIRRAFELPVTSQKDAMQSYLFYRLVGSASRLTMTYNNIAEYNHSSEISRYVQQLKHESGLPIKEKGVLTNIAGEQDQEIIVKKEQEVFESLKRYLVGGSSPQKRLSPSALNTYLDCSLRFYFRYVKNLYEPKEVIEDLNPSVLGNLLHGGMEALYEGKKELTHEDLISLTKELEAAVVKSFETQKLSVGDGSSKIGRQVIAYEVVKKYMEAILAFDKKNSPFTILGLEKEYYTELPVELPDESRKVALKGIIDRIDQKDEVVRIIDYKSGRDDRTFKEVELLVDGTLDKRDKAVFQLLYYCMLYKANHPENRYPLRPGLFNSKDLFDKNFDLLIYRGGRSKKAVLDYAEYEEEYISNLTFLLTQIFNPSIDFTQTKDEKKCQYCPYQNICMKG